MEDDEEEFYDEYPQVDEVMGSVTIENFGGGDEDAVAWLGKYRQYAIFMNLTPERQTAGFPLLLSGTASLWFDSLDERIKNRGFEEVAQAFLDKIQVKNNAYDVSLFKIQQLPSELAEQYVTLFQKQAQRVNLPENLRFIEWHVEQY